MNAQGVLSTPLLGFLGTRSVNTNEKHLLSVNDSPVLTAALLLAFSRAFVENHRYIA